MKKILLFIILIISLRGLSQFPINATNGSPSSGLMTKGRLLVDSLFQINSTCFADTTAANRGSIDAIAGAMIRTCDNTIWLRNTTATAWIASGGSSTTNITNIYNNSVVNIFILNDSCVVFQSGAGTNLDTICTVFDCGITGWTIQSLTSIQICGFICPDTTTEVCHTYTFPALPFYIFHNGLTQSPAGVVKWGGNLIENTLVNTQNYTATIGGYPYGRYPLQNFQQQSSLGSPGLQSWLHGYGVGNTVKVGMLYTDSAFTGGWSGWLGSNPGYFIATNIDGYGNFASGPITQSLNVSSNTSKIGGIFLATRNGSSTTLAGSLFGAAPPNASTIATLNNTQALNWLTTRQIQLPAYGSGTFTGTATKYLAVSSTGAIIEEAVPVGGFTTADNGLTANTATNVRLGGTLLQNTTIGGADTYNFTVNGLANGFMTCADGTKTTFFGVHRTTGITDLGSQAISGTGVAASIGTRWNSGVPYSQIALFPTNQEGNGSFLRIYQDSTVFNIIKSSTNTIENSLRFQRKTSGSAADGIGQSIDFYTRTTSDAGEVTQLANQIISKWTTAATATRTSQLLFEGVNNATTDDLMKLGDFVTLTEATATTFASTTIPTDKMGGGEIIVTVTANDASDIQSRTLRFIWTAVNDAGTTTITLGTPEEAVAVSSGTLTATITAVDAGSGVVNFKADATSSLTQTTLRCSYTFIKNF